MLIEKSQKLKTEMDEAHKQQARLGQIDAALSGKIDQAGQTIKALEKTLPELAAKAAFEEIDIDVLRTQRTRIRLAERDIEEAELGREGLEPMMQRARGTVNRHHKILANLYSSARAEILETGVCSNPDDFLFLAEAAAPNLRRQAEELLAQLDSGDAA
jgi:hypothetical protein